MGSYVYLYFKCLSCNIIDVCFFFIPLAQRVPSDLEVGYEKSILTRTETFSITFCFKEPLLQTLISTDENGNINIGAIQVLLLYNKFMSSSKLKKGSMFCDTRRQTSLKRNVTFKEFPLQLIFSSLSQKRNRHCLFYVVYVYQLYYVFVVMPYK